MAYQIFTHRVSIAVRSSLISLFISFMLGACSSKSASTGTDSSAAQITNFVLSSNRGFIQATWDAFSGSPAPAKYVLKLGYTSGSYTISQDISFGTNWADVGGLNTSGSIHGLLRAVDGSNQTIAESGEKSGSLATLAADTAESDGNTGSAKPISSGTPRWRSIFPASDEDFFQITFTTDPAGVVVETNTGDGVCALDTHLFILNSSLMQIASNDQGGISPCSRIVMSATGAGTYYIRVKGFGASDTGGYRLSVTGP